MKMSIFPIRVHCWGGLGSQLFAYVLARKIEDRYLNRNVVIIFHSSGITNRTLELPESALNAITYVVRDDFNRSKSPISNNPSKNFWTSNGYSLLAKFTRMVRRLMITSRFVSESNTEVEFDSLAPWLLSTRGHYTGLNLTDVDILRVLDALNLLPRKDNSSKTNAIHFRLGDLLKLKSKSYIRPSEIISIMSSDFYDEYFDVFSDSKREEVIDIFPSAFAKHIKEFHNLDTLSTISKCVAAQNFIGTNSKISLWIVILRCFLQESKASYLPISLTNQLKQLIPADLIGMHKVIPY
jgi:hypothetical protein